MIVYRLLDNSESEPRAGLFSREVRFEDFGDILGRDPAPRVSHFNQGVMTGVLGRDGDVQGSPIAVNRLHAVDDQIGEDRAQGFGIT